AKFTSPMRLTRMASVSTEQELERPKWSGFQQKSFFTFPVAFFVAVLIWLVFFIFLYDVYVTSFGGGSYFNYVSQAPIFDSARFTWSILGTRNTFGLALLAFVLAAPFLFAWFCLWMLKGGRALSRKILYLVHVRSMLSLIATTALVFVAAYLGAIIYGVVFYVIATKFGQTGAVAD